jgi:hypothetical protein
MPFRGPMKPAVKQQAKYYWIPHPPTTTFEGRQVRNDKEERLTHHNAARGKNRGRLQSSVSLITVSMTKKMKIGPTCEEEKAGPP